MRQKLIRDKGDDMNNQIRELRTVIKGLPVRDGNGVKITRMIGSSELNMLDPFLLFDVFESDNVNDYIGGFPDHPHRGFETVSYLLSGRMRHKDSSGHEGVIEPGGIQWMTAGKGIIHSEMPEQSDGLLQGFQLWVNLPAKDKMQAPAYQEFPVNQIPVEHLDNGVEIRVIAGITNNGLRGPVVNHTVNPTYMDISLSAKQSYQQQLKTEEHAFIYVIEGQLSIGDSKRLIDDRQLGVLQQGNQVIVTANTKTRFLLLAGWPVKEPVARGGPFVMNTKTEVMKAFEDFNNNTFL